MKLSIWNVGSGHLYFGPLPNVRNVRWKFFPLAPHRSLSARNETTTSICPFDVDLCSEAATNAAHGTFQGTPALLPHITLVRSRVNRHLDLQRGDAGVVISSYVKKASGLNSFVGHTTLRPLSPVDVNKHGG